MQAADRIRNVALVGHRGSGKTSLHEALLHEAGATTRLGSVADGTTVSDSDEDEKARRMSISASLASFEWRDVKVNLIDTPGEPSFIADALAGAVGGHPFELRPAAGLGVFTALFALLAIWGYRRDEGRRFR